MLRVIGAVAMCGVRWPAAARGRGVRPGTPLTGFWCQVRLVSNLAYEGDDHPDAAAKNLDDAMTLLAARRFDGAGYLAGYVVECSLKTVIVLQEIARHAGFTPTSLAAGLVGHGAQTMAGSPRGTQKGKTGGQEPEGKATIDMARP